MFASFRLTDVPSRTDGRTSRSAPGFLGCVSRAIWRAALRRSRTSCHLATGRPRSRLIHEGLEQRHLLSAAPGVLPSDPIPDVPVKSSVILLAPARVAPPLTTTVVAKVAPVAQVQQAPAMPVNQQNARIDMSRRVLGMAIPVTIRDAGAKPIPAPEVVQIGTTLHFPSVSAAHAQLPGVVTKLNRDVVIQDPKWNLFRDFYDAITTVAGAPNPVDAVAAATRAIFGPGANQLITRFDVTEYYAVLVTQTLPAGNANPCSLRILKVTYSCDVTANNPAAGTGVDFLVDNVGRQKALSNLRTEMGCVAVLYDATLNNAREYRRAGVLLPSVEQWLWDKASLRVQAKRPAF